MKPYPLRRAEVKQELYQEWHAGYQGELNREGGPFMRNMIVLLVLVVTASYAFVDSDGCNDLSAAESSSISSNDADITLSIENTWEITWCTQALGMDAWVDGSTINIIFSSNTDMQINSLDPATGAWFYTMPQVTSQMSGLPLSNTWEKYVS